MIRRLGDWPRRLDTALTAARERPHAYGEHDCCLLAADVVDAMCGTEIAGRWRGRYKTARGARGLLKRRGGIEAEMARWGVGERPVLMAQRGDVMEIPVPEELAEVGLLLGVCVGDGIAGAAPRGWWIVPLRRASRAWHVPMEGEA